MTKVIIGSRESKLAVLQSEMVKSYIEQNNEENSGQKVLVDILTMKTTGDIILDRTLDKVGGTGEVKIDVRIITATHVDMQKLIEQERFREDLFYRLMGLSINLPKLSERGDDILLLANHFIKGYCSKSKKAICTLSKEAKEVLLRYSFPGNIRELKAMMELAVVLSENNVIRPEDLTLRHEVARDEKDFLEDISEICGFDEEE